ncbi:Transcriptional regulator, GntR family domain / Aspartate aminotransferase [Thermococcus sp. 2319x1]|uniref:DUF2341 domain-containing protein n=1 Tax=Thermococcus sp. 2319x1 TaxID=1674923 RepID=UPI00073AD158|nr:DUF2341 domain-containing protein [Thermococcus sp. 2319x1]ALV63911.1 Transcriptional regulator, GntR family domain / Aspartate aminotransferase [Thermococcus sp. 2319x1]
MRRRGFVLNSAVLVLLIPMLLLLATYEDVSSQIFRAQNERVLVERSFRGVAYFDSDFQRALEISGKRALIAAIDYVTATEEFIKQKMANETLKDLILFGTSEELSGYENLEKIMQNQTIERWLILTREYLLEQGFLIEQSNEEILNNMRITVGVLDSFTIFVKAKIPNITVRDFNGKIVYSGSIPKSGNPTYVFIDIRNLEDPLFPPMTGGRYSRSIRACVYPYPELTGRPVKVLEGKGSSDRSYVLGEFSRSIGEDYIYFGDFYPGDGALAYVLLNGSLELSAPIIVNTSVGGIPISPINVLDEGDAGVLVFRNLSAGSERKGWCALSYNYRVNVTITNPSPTTLTNFQVPITLKLSSNKISLPQTPNIVVYDGDCNPINFWVEKWEKTGNTVDLIIWVRTSISAGSSKTLSIYFDSSAPIEWGDPNLIFEFYEDFEDGNLDGWEFAGPTNWTATTDDARSGSYSAKSGVLSSKRETSCMYRTVTVSGDSELSFWWKVNNNKGILSFYLNNTLKDTTTNTNWQNKTYELSPSSYVIKWCFNTTKRNPKDSDVGYVDLIIIRKAGGSGVSVTSSEVESKPEYPLQPSVAKAYDLQPFLECLLEQRYFGVYNGWSIFERLEGSYDNHEKYEELANKTQDELGISYEDKHYPIGLVSFMIPHDSFDSKLYTLFALGLTARPLKEGQSSADYYFLQYYFGNGNETNGYRMWGVSYGTLDVPYFIFNPPVDLSFIPFFLDNQTAISILSNEAACDLLEGYTCS